MGQIRQRLNLTKPENEFEKTAEVELQTFIKDLANIINKGLKFSDNFNAEIVEVSDTGLIDTTFTVAHTLKRVPTGFILTYTDKAGIIYTGISSWTVTNIYLRCNVANAHVRLLIF